MCRYPVQIAMKMECFTNKRALNLLIHADDLDEMKKRNGTRREYGCSEVILNRNWYLNRIANACNFLTINPLESHRIAVVCPCVFLCLVRKFFRITLPKRPNTNENRIGRLM